VEIVYERVAGIDVGKKIIAVAVRTPGERPGKRRQQLRKYNTFYQTLTEMVAWLVAEGVTHVTMEATGIYWKPIFHALCAAERRWRCCWSMPGTSRTSRVAKAMPSTRCGWRS
jgi:transposase